MHAGRDEAGAVVLARCMGPLACYCSFEELSSVVLAGALGPPASTDSQRLGQALTLSAVAQNAAPR